MNELLTILRELHPDIDFETATGLVEDSAALWQLIQRLDEA